MGFMKQAMLLLLLAAVSIYADATPEPHADATPEPHADPTPTPDPCDDLKKVVPVKDVHEVVGDWVLVWAIANNEMLKHVNNSHVKLSVSHDNKTLRFLENSVLQNKSHILFDANITVSDDPEDLHFVNVSGSYTVDQGDEEEYPHKGEFEFIKSPKDTLTLRYKDDQGHFLLFYKEEGHDHDHDHDHDHEENEHHKKLAECLRSQKGVVYEFHGGSDVHHN